MTPTPLYVILALIAGSCLPIQAGVNSRLSQWARSPILASTISFAVGTTVLVACSSLARVPLPHLSGLSAHPWWMWTGGLLGAIAVFSAILLAPRLGATAMLSLILAGQMLASLVLDQYGFVGYPVRPLNVPKLVGAGLLVAGVVVIQFSR